MYEALYHLYYKSPEQWEPIYQQRFHAPFTRHIPLSIKQYGRKQVHPCFYCYTEDISQLQESIMQDFATCQKVLNEIPTLATKQFLYDCMIEEIKSTNDIEGVRSTRREILSALDTAKQHRNTMRMGSIVNQYELILHGHTFSFANSQDIRNLFDAFLFQEIKSDDPMN